MALPPGRAPRAALRSELVRAGVLAGRRTGHRRSDDGRTRPPYLLGRSLRGNLARLAAQPRTSAIVLVAGETIRWATYGMLLGLIARFSAPAGYGMGRTEREAQSRETGASALEMDAWLLEQRVSCSLATLPARVMELTLSRSGQATRIIDQTQRT